MANNVGAPTADAVHKDGTEHIKEQLENRQGGVGEETQGTAATAAPIVPAQPPASNPGADDPTAGIPKDAGGVSSAAHVQAAGTKSEKRKSIVGTLTGFLGFGKEKKEKEARNVGSDTPETGAAEIAAGAVGAGAAGAGTTAVLADRTKAKDQPGSKSAAGGTDVTKDSATEANTSTPAGAANPAAETFDKSPADSAQNKSANMQSEERAEKEESAEKPPKSGADPKKMENRDAIPTAGGEKIGEKHWGESKIVPDNPQPKEEQGVASSDNTKEVSDNTAKNTGGATSGPSGSSATSPSGEGEKKEKFMDKIKDKLKGNKKESS